MTTQVDLSERLVVADRSIGDPLARLNWSEHGVVAVGDRYVRVRSNSADAGSPFGGLMPTSDRPRELARFAGVTLVGDRLGVPQSSEHSRRDGSQPTGGGWSRSFAA